MGKLFTKEKQDLDLLGWDFSHVAIQEATKTNPQDLYFLHHQNLGLPFVHKSCSHKFAIDSLYPDSTRRNPTADFISNVRALLSNGPDSLYIVQNFPEGGLPQEKLSIPGFDVSLSDYTKDFSQLVDSWLKALDTQDVHIDRKKYKILWSTIEREFSHHQRSLNEKPLKRLRILYKKI